MKYSNSEISFYVDTMIVETLLTDSHLEKFGQDGMISSLLSKVKEYFGAHFNSEDKIGSVINMLAPGMLWVGLKAMNLSWLGFLLSMAMNLFHIDVASILREAWNGIKGVISSGKQTSSEHVDGIVDSAVAGHVKPATEEEAAKAEQTLKKDSAKLLRDARFFKLAMMEYKRSPESFTKEAGIFNWFATKKSGTGTFLGIVIKWLFKIVLASAGLMVAGDVVNKFLGRANALDGSLQGNKPVETPAVPVVTSKQTRFKVNPSYQDFKHSPKSSWTENVTNTEQGIASMLLSWAKEVYQGLNGLDNVIRNTAGFQTMVETIAWKNSASEGGPIVFIPLMGGAFASKKMIVDHFIDEVAEKAPK